MTAACAAALALLCTPALGAPATNVQPAKAPLVLAAGTPVNVHLVKAISSADANAGDTFAIAAADDVVVGGVIVVRKDAVGEGSVVAVDRAGSHGHAGTLALGYSWITSVAGAKIALSTMGPAAAPAGNSAGAANAAAATQVATTGASIAGAAAPQLLGSVASFAGPLVSVASAFMRGKNVSVDPSRTLNAFVAVPVQIGK